MFSSSPSKRKSPRKSIATSTPTASHNSTQPLPVSNRASLSALNGIGIGINKNDLPSNKVNQPLDPLFQPSESVEKMYPNPVTTTSTKSALKRSKSLGGTALEGEGAIGIKEKEKDNQTTTIMTSSRDKAGPRKSAFRAAPPQRFASPEPGPDQNQDSSNNRRSGRLSSKPSEILASIGAVVGGFIGGGESKTISTMPSHSEGIGSEVTQSSEETGGSRPGIKRNNSAPALDALAEGSGSGPEAPVVKKSRKSVVFRKQRDQLTRFAQDEPTERIRRASFGAPGTPTSSTSATNTSQSSFSSSGQDLPSGRRLPQDDDEDSEESSEDDESDEELEALNFKKPSMVGSQEILPRNSLTGSQGFNSNSVIASGSKLELQENEDESSDEDSNRSDSFRKSEIRDGDRTQTMQITEVHGGMLDGDLSGEQSMETEEESTGGGDSMSMDMDLTNNLTGGIERSQTEIETEGDESEDDEEDEEEVERSILMDQDDRSGMDFTVALGGIENDSPVKKQVSTTSKKAMNPATTQISTFRKSLPASKGKEMQSKVPQIGSTKSTRASMGGAIASASNLKRKATEDLSNSQVKEAPTTRPVSAATIARRARASMPASRGGATAAALTSARGGKVGRASVGATPAAARGGRGGSVSSRGGSNSLKNATSSTPALPATEPEMDMDMDESNNSSMMDQSNINGADRSGMEMTQALGGILEDGEMDESNEDSNRSEDNSSSRFFNEAPTMTMNMDMTQALGGILDDNFQRDIPATSSTLKSISKPESPIRSKASTSNQESAVSSSRRGHEHCSHSAAESPNLNEKKKSEMGRNSPQFVLKSSPTKSPYKSFKVQSPSKTQSVSSPNKAKTLAVGRNSVATAGRTSLPARRVQVSEDPTSSPSKKNLLINSGNEAKTMKSEEKASNNVGRKSMPASNSVAALGPTAQRKLRMSLASMSGSSGPGSDSGSASFNTAQGSTSRLSSAAPVAGRASTGGPKVRRRSSLLAAVPSVPPPVAPVAPQEVQTLASKVSSAPTDSEPGQDSMQSIREDDSEMEETLEPEAPRRMRLEEFLPIIKVEFHDTSEFKASKRQVEPPSNHASTSSSVNRGKRSSNEMDQDEDSEEDSQRKRKLDWEKQFKLAMMEAGEATMLKQLEESCLALESEVKASSETLKQQETQFYLNPPDFVQEVLDQDANERKEIEPIFGLQKQAARATAIRDYYDWRAETEFNDEVLEGLRQNVEKLVNDEEMIVKNGRLLKESLLPTLRERDIELERELEIERKRCDEIEEMKENLDQAMEEIGEQGRHLSTERAKYLEEKEELQRSEDDLSKLSAKRQAVLEGIEQSKQIFERIDGCTKEEAKRLQSELNSLSKLHLTQLIEVTSNQIILIHDSILRVTLELATKSNGKIREGEERGVLVKKAEIQFVDQWKESLEKSLVFNFSLNALVQGVEKELELSDHKVNPKRILQIVSSTWTCAHQLQHEIDRLSSHYPISTSLSKDQASLIVETSLLFIKPKSKVRVKAICERESLFSISQDGGFDLKDGVASFVPGKVVVESVYGKADSLAIGALITDCLTNASAMGSLAGACVEAVRTFDV